MLAELQSDSHIERQDWRQDLAGAVRPVWRTVVRNEIESTPLFNADGVAIGIFVPLPAADQRLAKRGRPKWFPQKAFFMISTHGVLKFWVLVFSIFGRVGPRLDFASDRRKKLVNNYG